MRHRGLLCGALLLATTAGSAAAEELRLEISAAESSISYTLPGNVHTVHGQFRLSEANLVFDPERRTIEGRIVADATSGTAENPKVVQRMHRAILESDSYPEISFRPVSYAGEFDAEGTSRLEVVGFFGLHGAEHSIAIPLEAEIDGERLTVRSSFEIPYVEWGLKAPSRFVFRSAPEVELVLELEGRLRRVDSGQATSSDR